MLWPYVGKSLRDKFNNMWRDQRNHLRDRVMDELFGDELGEVAKWCGVDKLLSGEYKSDCVWSEVELCSSKN